MPATAVRFASVTPNLIVKDVGVSTAVAKDRPSFAAPSFGGTGTLFVIVEGVDALHDVLSPQVSIVMSLRTQPYGMREFAVMDPDGHLITFAERVG